VSSAFYDSRLDSSWIHRHLLCSHDNDVEDRPAFQAARGATTIRDDLTSSLPAGYRLDLLSDPCIITLLRPDGTVVARFTRFADPEEIRRAAEKDHRARGGRDG
jgi:hypothetical protein